MWHKVYQAQVQAQQTYKRIKVVKITYPFKMYHDRGMKEGNRLSASTRILCSICLIFSCISTANEWRKFPPNTRESAGVQTAWIHPEGIMNVLPGSNPTRWHSSTRSAKKTLPCSPPQLHSSKSWRFLSVGSINQNIFFPVRNFILSFFNLKLYLLQFKF